MKPPSRIAKDESLLVLPVQVWAWAFFILPVIRLIVFRSTGFALPLSAQNAVLISATFVYLLLSGASLKLSKALVTGVLILCVAFMIYVSVGNSSNSLNAVLATTWVYFVAPSCAMLIGALGADHTKSWSPKRAAHAVDRWLNISVGCIFLGVFLNMIDIALLGDSYSDVYKDFGTTAAATFGELSLPRLAGAYFSGLDLTLAIVLLFLIQSSRKKDFALIVKLPLFLAVLLTFTRNSYVILIVWLIVARFSNLQISRFSGFMYLLSPVMSFGVMIALAIQTSSGELEMNAETSSLITRLSSWALVLDAIYNNPLASLYGLGLTQNSLVPGESDIYAIDNFFWELICYSGVIGFFIYGFLFHAIRMQALKKKTAMSRVALSLTALIPVAGIFNNMAGTMFSLVLFICFGSLGQFMGVYVAKNKKHGK